VAALFCVVVTAAMVSGCGSGQPTGGGSGPTGPPEIVTQPSNQGVPMGLTATFSVAADGWPITFQWLKNGTAIAGATNESYTTPSTQFTDSGSTYSVTLTNSLGSVTSNAATLTVTARAPTLGDLRFQEVDSVATVNGWPSGGELAEIGGTVYLQGFPDSTGTPLSVGPGCPANGGDRFSCSWDFESTPLPTGFSGLSTYYELFSLDNDGLATELGSLSSANAVVTNIDIEPLSDLFAISWIQPTVPKSAGVSDPWGASDGTFDMASNTVSPASFQTAASQDGANSRVITAVSWNNGQITYLSYGWSNDTTTVYDVQTATATFSTIGTVAQQLAADGYIITAVGGTAPNGLLLVGTRVQGDTKPRPFLFEDVEAGGKLTSISNGGYAVVGFLVNVDSSGNMLHYDWIGER